MYSPGCICFSTVYCAISKNMTCIERARENNMAVVILIALLVIIFTVAARIDWASTKVISTASLQILQIFNKYSTNILNLS